jgi:uncharacterized membrane protein
MRTPARFGGHPLHPMLVAFPIGLLVASYAFDLIHLWKGEELWANLAFYDLAAGLIGAAAAAIPGFIDYVSLTDEKVLPLAHWHFGVNLALIGVYAIDFWLRTESGQSTLDTFRLAPFLLSTLGLLLLTLSGWLGGELVYVHGVAVDSTIKENQTN